jgi:hypothetical protein
VLNVIKRLIIMPSIFKAKNHKVSKLSSLIHSTSGIFYGVGFLRGRVGKLRQTQFNSTIMSISSTTTTSIGSNSFTSNSPLCHRPPIGKADLMLQPNLVSAFVSQTSDPKERPPNTTSTNPGTEMHSRDISSDVPPSPLSQDSIPANDIFVSEVQANQLMEGITYDAILVSTLHQNLGMIMMEGTKYLDIPATRTPPDSPAAIQEGGFGSLMGVSMAIMKGKT